MASNLWFWFGFLAFILAMLALDLGVFHREAHEVRPREAALWTALWVALALLFALLLRIFEPPGTALTFLTGYVLEESLSADNIFVIALIFAYFGVPKRAHHRVLFYGILGALVLRGAFIAVGALLLARFDWVLYVFGALLVFTGVRMGVQGEQEEFDGERNLAVRLTRRFVPMTPHYDDARFFTVENARRLATPLLLVLVLVEITDLAFAIDSIPAIFGVTRDPFLVFTSNVFAILGLRSLFFLLASVIDRFHLLRYGLSLILTFIGVKMLADHWVQVPIGLSLTVILTVLAASVAASLIWPRRAADG
ncbi:MAG: TerC family protein [Gemmatimonadota bacterium]|nr:TerC family protein [Gemmatimonadota bacterium]MDE3171556.1 TerC family protein [Gemmatimonadota bacterium]MDE3216023.1 TerC family protein [Gemmatimonadota bacterium]